MTFSLADLDRGIAPLRPFEGADLVGLPRDELLGLLRSASASKRALDVLIASIAGEVARRSTPDDGPAGLARQQGFASPEQFVASVMGADHGVGVKLVSAGQSLAADRPVGDALRRGDLTVDKAELIAKVIAPLTGDTRELEQKLVRLAKALDFARFKLACRTEAARHDAVQLEGRERRQFEARGLDISEDAFGVTHFRGQVDPVRGAILRTYMDAQVKAAFQAARDGESEARTATQIRADALIALATHGLDCESKATGVKATVIVRIDKDQLADELGVATCDAIATPISLRALRELAVDASILPIVMNGTSEVLDMGREERLFNWRQRMALAERDGGCAKCHAPISHCITHHIRWWSTNGRTDLKNGVLLCTRCHTQVHHDNWHVEVDEHNQVWFITPRHLDPDRSNKARTRILGGLAALTVV